jgi:hypothetical protein
MTQALYAHMNNNNNNNKQKKTNQPNKQTNKNKQGAWQGWCATWVTQEAEALLWVLP